MKLLPRVREVFEVVADNDLAVVFGHATHAEIFEMAEQVQRMGIRKAFVDHPFSPFVALSVAQMKELTSVGIYMNFTFDELSPLLGLNPAVMCSAIQELGTDHVTLSSDCGEPWFRLPRLAEAGNLSVMVAGTRMDQRIRFCEVDGSRVAFATAGRGPALVVDTGWVGHLEFMWQSQAYRSFFEALAQTRTIVRFDKPGTGLSDRERRDFSVDVEVRALEGVIASLGLRTFDVLGTSQGGLVAAHLAHRNPRQVSRLILYGTWACGRDLAPDAVKSSVLALIRAHWGLGSRTLADIFLAGEDSAAAAWFAEAQRVGASAEVAANLLDESYRTDVGDMLPALTIPTLVLHRQDDRAVPFQLGREVAAHIPDAVFAPLRGMAHLPYFGDTEPLLEDIHGFLTSEAVVPLSPREREVVTLVARGLTNREIADALVISQRTAENHLQHVLNRLELRSRVQLATWAIEHGFSEAG